MLGLLSSSAMWNEVPCPAKDFWSPEIPQLLDCPRRLEWPQREQATHALGSQPEWAHVGEKRDRTEDHEKVKDEFGGRGTAQQHLLLHQRKE